MYFSPGASPNEIGDFEIVEQDRKLHCFYLALPSHDAIGHLVSEDGINWEQLPTAIRTGDPGEFDDDQIWTMGVFNFQNKWFMLYTAVSRHGMMQDVGLATSDDLIHWEKAKNNPVISPDPRWYEAEQIGRYRVDWRDPHVIEHEGKLHGFICARTNEGLLNRRGCSGYFTSEDGYNWEVRPPACIPAACFDFECPSVWKHNGRFYMAAIAGAHARGVYRIADKVEGPYRRPYDDSLMPDGNLSVRPCMWRGQVHLFHWQRGIRDWDSGAGSGYSMLASPKTVSYATDGSLDVQSFDWSTQTAAPTISITPETPSNSSCGNWSWSSQSLQAQNEDGAAIWLMENELEDFILEGEFLVDATNPAKEFGFVLRANEDGNTGLFASCIPGRGAVELVKYIHNRKRGPESLWRGREVKQSYHYRPPEDGKYSFRLIAFGPSIEFNVNGRLALATMSLPRRAGRTGLFLEDGRGTFSSLSIQPLKPPACKWEW